MNNSETERLYNLLPTIYRQRDVAEGEPLRALLAVMERELQAIEADIDGLYENWFIETCEDWVVPYLADLVGIRGLTDKKSILFNQRSYVANAIAYRRRKGVAAILENIMFDVTGWRARVVECFERLSMTQNVQHLRPGKGSTVDLRNRVNLERLNSPFNTVAHRVDVRRISPDGITSGQSLAAIRGQYNISNLALFVWRLQSYSVKNSPAYPVENRPGCYRFHPLGIDTPLFNQPQIQTGSTQIAEEINLPVAIGRQAFEADLKHPSESQYYGANRSINIIKDGKNVPAENVVSMDLRDWQRRPPEGKVAVDVNLGRLALPNPESGNGTIFSKDTTVTGSDTKFTEELKVGDTIYGAGQVRRVSAIASDTELTVETAFSPDLPSQTPFTFEKRLNVSYCYGFSADRGGGTYDRRQSLTPLKDGKNTTLQQALTDCERNCEEKVKNYQGVVEIRENKLKSNQELTKIPIPEASGLTIQAANGMYAYVNSLLVESQDADASLILNGLLIEKKIIIKGSLKLNIKHCTVIGGIDVDSQENTLNLQVDISDSIVGALRLPETASLRVRDSIVDGGLTNAIAARDRSEPPNPQPSHQDYYAIAASHTDAKPGARTRLERTTVFGKVNISELTLAANVIFTASVTVQRQQTGSVEFSYVPEGSQTPRRYRCQPDLALESLDLKDKNKNEKDQIKSQVKSRLKPSFTSARYGNPGYAQLSLSCPIEVSTGADDGSEMGAFYKLHQPQRAAYLRLSLDEFVPAGLDAGVFYVT